VKLTLTRTFLSDTSTQGELYIDGQAFCVTLELPVKDGLPGSAIPEGTYPVVLAPSPKFMRSNDPWVLKFAQLMPHIIHIPNRTLIMLHWGNTAEDTDGCVLIGSAMETNYIRNSRQAFEKLWLAIETPARSNDCTITVVNGLILSQGDT
jgi:Family of unknown function (DUF5675)